MFINCHKFRQRVKGVILPFLLLFLIQSLSANNYQNILFKPATASYTQDNSKQISSSNQINLKIKDEKTALASLTFYKKSESSNDSLTFLHTEFFTSRVFTPMKPLLEKNLKVEKSLFFNANEPLLISYVDNNSTKNSFFDIKISSNFDKELVRIYRVKNSNRFTGYIEVESKVKKEGDGKIYANDGAKVKATLNDLFAVATIKTKKNVENSTLWTSIIANKSSLSIGEFIKYTIIVENKTNIDAKDILVKNVLFNGLKYNIDSFKEDVDFSKDKKEFSLKIQNLKKGDSFSFSFIASVDIGAKDYIKSISYATSNSEKSNLSVIKTKVKDDFSNKSLILGKVMMDGVGVSGIRFYLQDGTSVLSDRFGKFHFANKQLGTYVVSIDTKLKLLECKSNTRSLGSSHSRFVNTRNSHIQKVTFCLKKDELKSDENITKKFKIPNRIYKNMPEFSSLDFDKHKEDEVFLWPKEGFVPSMPSVKVAFILEAKDKMELYLNGKKVDMLNFDGYVKSKNQKRVIYTYRGIDIVDATNIFEAKILDKKGNIKKVIKRTIHLSTSPVKAEVIEEKSYLVADGKNSSVIAVQFFDNFGYPLRSGMVGTFIVEKPYASQSTLNILKDNPLAKISGDHKYTIVHDGIAYIELQATSKSGEVKLHFPFQNKNKYTKAWLKSKKRDWLIVGFAKGSVGYREIKKNLKKVKKEPIYKDGDLAFFAKGTIMGDALLSIAYDSGKRSDLGLIEEINPKSEYTIYGDESVQKNEAPSSKKLYLKIEKQRFYALFGDFDTGLDTHMLSRYSRRLNGVKSEFKGEVFEYNAFISQNRNLFVKDEIRGDGTSGYYKLTNQDIVEGSEKIYLEVRDRYREEIIISKKPLRSIYDYNIDYFAGRLYFKEPISSRDESGNEQFIVVEYEKIGGDKKSYTYGGRGAVRLFDGRLEFGASLINEREKQKLYGIDARVKVDENIIIDAEYAKSNKSAYLVELAHHNKISETKIYYKLQESGFGLGQQNSSEKGESTYGIETKINYWKNIAINFLAYGDKALKSGEYKNSIESFVRYKKEGFIGVLGYRYGKASSEMKGKSQLLSSISKRFFHNRIKVAISNEYSLNGKSDYFKNRSFLEATYNINQYVTVFANHEILEGKTQKSNTNTAGLKTRPWSGANIKSGISEEFGSDTSRVFGDLGINQMWKVNDNWMLSFAYEREKTIKGVNENRDYSSYSFSTNYKKNRWVTSSKSEYKTGEKDEKINLDFGVFTDVNEHLALSFGNRVNLLRGDKKSDKIDAKLSFAYRDDNNFVLLNSLNYLYEKDEKIKLAKIIDSLKFILYPTVNSTLSGHYGLKYTQDFIDAQSFSSLIDTVGIEYIYDLTKKIDLGFGGSLLHSYCSSNFDTSFGVFGGYNIYKNVYLGLGYNFLGFYDSDFEGLRRSENGVYLQFRMKFDNESSAILGINKIH